MAERISIPNSLDKPIILSNTHKPAICYSSVLHYWSHSQLLAALCVLSYIAMGRDWIRMDCFFGLLESIFVFQQQRVCFKSRCALKSNINWNILLLWFQRVNAEIIPATKKKKPHTKRPELHLYCLDLPIVPNDALPIRSLTRTHTHQPWITAHLTLIPKMIHFSITEMTVWNELCNQYHTFVNSSSSPGNLFFYFMLK